MRFIRTKDGNIYDINKEYCGRRLSIDEKRAGPYKKEIKLIFNGKGGWFGKRIEMQADSIEELCDELVVHNPSNDGDFYPKHFVYKNKWETMLEPISDYQKSKGIEIYGAIWTDKGLIYVAKMNEKGELELL